MARVCMVLNNFEPPYGGPELQAQKIAARLIERGHNLIFVAKGSGAAPDYEVVAGIPVYRLNKKGFASIQAMFMLRRLKDEFDVLHVHGVGRLASVAISFAKKFNKKVFIKVTTAGHIVKAIPSGPAGWLKRLSPFRNRKVEILKQADGMIAISQEILTELMGHGFAPKKIYTIPNGVDTKKFYPPTAEDKASLRAQLNLPQDKTIFLFTGKITRRKGIDVLLQAWQQAKGIHVQALLVLVGSGQGQSDSLEEWLDKFIAEHNLKESVLRTGAVNNVDKWLQAADVFVFPSRREGLPNSLLEAMASGLVCLASKIGGNVDLITPGETGMLVPEDVAEWAEALKRVMQKPNMELGIAAVAFIKEKYSIDVTVSRLEALYRG